MSVRFVYFHLRADVARYQSGALRVLGNCCLQTKKIRVAYFFFTPLALLTANANSSTAVVF
jgi:hypothetical protein